MKRRTIIGIIYIVVALLKLADLWGIWYIDWLWKHPWPTYFAVFLLLYIGVELIISSYHRNRQINTFLQIRKAFNNHHISR